MIKIIQSILNRTGIKFEYIENKSLEYTAHYEVRDVNISSSDGYILRFLIGDTRGKLEFELETFAKSLNQEIKKVPREKFLEFQKLATTLDGTLNTLNLDRVEVLSYDKFVDNQHCGFGFESKMYDLRKEENTELLVSELSRIAEFFVMTFLPYTDEILGEVEGRLVQTTVNKYERSRKNRSLCISFHGTSCSICSFNFEETYGEKARDYIHVHHVNQVSDMVVESKVDPVRDLIPLCPNCHSVVHLKNPPYTPEEVKKMLRK